MTNLQILKPNKDLIECRILDVDVSHGIVFVEPIDLLPTNVCHNLGVGPTECLEVTWTGCLKAGPDEKVLVDLTDLNDLRISDLSTEGFSETSSEPTAPVPIINLFK